MSTLFQMSEVPDDKQEDRGWAVQVNGVTAATVNEASLTHPKMGIEVKYGQRPEGYDGVVIREPGGAATIPYMIDSDGRIYVGVVSESRPTMGQAVTNNIPRGFSDFMPSGELEDQEVTAKRELHEETGFRALGNRVVQLASGLNPNSTYFDYSQGPDAGVGLFAVQLKEEELVQAVTESGGMSYVFPEAVQKEAQTDKVAERILGSRFIPLQEALRSRDMFTCAAAGQLLARLLDQGEYLVPQNMPKKTADLE